MGKVDVGGGKPFHLAPSPKHQVAGPAKPVPRSWSFPKPSRASVYRNAAPHRVVSHNAGYGPRPTPRGSGVHAAVRAQPVRSQGHSAATARLASKLAQQTSARAATKASTLAQLLGQQRGLSSPDVWNPVNYGVAGVANNVWAAIKGDLEGKALGLPPPGSGSLDIGPQGGLFYKGFPGYDRLPQQPPVGYSFRGRSPSRIPIPRANTRPLYRGRPQSREDQQLNRGFVPQLGWRDSPGGPGSSPRRGLANPYPHSYGNNRA